MMPGFAGEEKIFTRMTFNLATAVACGRDSPRPERERGAARRGGRDG